MAKKEKVAAQTAVETKLYDVVIYKMDTKAVESVVGTNMERSDGHYNAQRRLETVILRLNDSYFARIVPAGKYKVGDILKG